jgi:hypothetical protein
MWGETPGQAYIATLTKGGEFSQFMLEWPRSRQAIPKFILSQVAEGRDTYYCPSLFVPFDKTVEFNHKGKTAATRANIQGSQSFWVDFDNGAAPSNWSEFAKEKGIPEPSMVIQSSVSGNQHAYWRTEFNTSVDDIEQTNRSLALTVGADRSGWDGNQLLRPPFTTNFGYKGNGDRKPWFRGQPVEVNVIGPVSYDSVRTEEFSNLGSVEREILDSLQLAGNVPSIESVLAYGKWSKELFEQFSMDQQEASDSSPDKRSGAIQKLAYLAAESGMTDDQIYSILDFADKRWEKYVKRSPSIRHKLLTDIIARARVKVGYLTDDMLTFAGLLGKSDEVTEVPKLVYSWDEFLAADFYVEWLIDGLLSTTGYGVLTGQPGVGKTQLGLQLAISLALGHSSILGFHVNGGARKGLMFSLEMGKESLKHISHKIQNQYPGLEREIGKNFKIVPLGKAINILSVEGRNFLESILSEQKPDFIYIDSLKKIMSKSLNDDEGIRMMNDIIQEIRERHRCAVFVVHHDRKKQNGGKGTDAGDLSDMYGSQYIAAEADFALSLRKTEKKGLIVMDHWKVRLDEEPSPKYLQRNDNLQFEITEAFSNEEGDNLRIIGSPSSSDSDPDEEGPGFRM